MKPRKTSLSKPPVIGWNSDHPVNKEDLNQDRLRDLAGAEESSGYSLPKKTLFIDMDNVLVDFPSGIAQLSKKILTEYEDRLDEVPGIFALMEPMSQAVESFVELCEHFDTYILSTAPWKNPSAWSDKLLWVQKHLGQHAHKRLILSHHKHLTAGILLLMTVRTMGRSISKANGFILAVNGSRIGIL